MPIATPTAPNGWRCQVVAVCMLAGCTGVLLGAEFPQAVAAYQASAPALAPNSLAASAMHPPVATVRGPSPVHGQHAIESRSQAHARQSNVHRHPLPSDTTAISNLNTEVPGAGSVVSSGLALLLGMAVTHVIYWLLGAQPQKVAMAAWASEPVGADVNLESQRKCGRLHKVRRFLGKLMIAALLCSMLFLGADPAEAIVAGRRGGGGGRARPTVSKNFEKRAPGIGLGHHTAPHLVDGIEHIPFGYGSVGLARVRPIYGQGLLGWTFKVFFFWGCVLNVMFKSMLNLMGFMAGAGPNLADAPPVFEDTTASVIKVQVGLLDSAQGMQTDIMRIVKNTDTSKPEGMQYILRETVFSLLCNPNSCVYGMSECKQRLSGGQVEPLFRTMMMGQGRTGPLLTDMGSATEENEEDGGNLIMVTVVLAVEGNIRVPKVTDKSSLKRALKQLGRIGEQSLLTVEILWTPEKEGDSFSQEEYSREYPLINRL